MPIPRRVIVAMLIAIVLSTANQVTAAPVPSTATTFAAQDAVGTPFIPADLPPSVSEAGAQPLSVKDCDAVSPLTRDDVVQILLTSPVNPGNLKPGEADQNFRPGAQAVAIGEIPTDVLTRVEQTLRTWQVCRWLGQTYQQMALETEQFIREDIYASTEIMTPYSESTINELLDRREDVAALHNERMSGPGIIASMSPLAIDQSGFAGFSAEGDYVSLEVLVVDNYNGEQMLNTVGNVSFRFVDGTWLVDMVSLTQY